MHVIWDDDGEDDDDDVDDVDDDDDDDDGAASAAATAAADDDDDSAPLRKIRRTTWVWVNTFRASPHRFEYIKDRPHSLCTTYMYVYTYVYKDIQMIIHVHMYTDSLEYVTGEWGGVYKLDMGIDIWEERKNRNKT